MSTFNHQLDLFAIKVQNGNTPVATKSFATKAAARSFMIEMLLTQGNKNGQMAEATAAADLFAREQTSGLNFAGRFWSIVCI